MKQYQAEVATYVLCLIGVFVAAMIVIGIITTLKWAWP